MQLPSITCTVLSSLSVTPLIFCVTDFVSAIKQNVSIDLWQNFFVRLSNIIVGLDYTPFSKMFENNCCRSKKNFYYHNILLSSQNDKTGSTVV